MVVADGKHLTPAELRIVWNDNFYKDFATLSLMKERIKFYPVPSAVGAKYW